MEKQTNHNHPNKGKKQQKAHEEPWVGNPDDNELVNEVKEENLSL